MRGRLGLSLCRCDFELALVLLQFSRNPAIDLNTEPIKKQTVTINEVVQATGAKLIGDGSIPLTDVTHDSRQAGKGSLFVAVRGELFDAHKFVPQVIEQGAAGVVSEVEPPTDWQPLRELQSGKRIVPAVWLQVENVRRAMAVSAAVVHHYPSKELQLVGITGTNGKTTTAYLIASIPEAAGEPVAMTGTVEYRLGSERKKAGRTTPEATDMQRLLRQAVEIGCRTAVMEASSQAMDFHRCDELQANQLEQEGLSVIRYAVKAEADVTAANPEFALTGMRFRLRTPAGDRDFHSPLVGPPHIYNTLTAVASGLALGYSLEIITKALERCTGAPGRFERVPHDGDFAVVVDYAHSDDALLNVLRTARDVTRGRIITVFGCGGDRDASKRAPMGEAAGSLSDVVILTSDNPRTEDPKQILADAEKGIQKTGKPYEKIADRREAINQAIAQARTHDLVLIAGKGHEDYQIIGREVFHFDDKEVAREALLNRSR